MFGFIGYATLSYGRSVPALCEQKGAHSSIERTYYMTVEQDPGEAALFEKFGTYILPGRVNDPRRGIEEAQEAERIGLGAVWISERFALKEPAVLAGAVSEATSKIRISGTMYATMRHPIVTASVANMKQAMSGACFRLMFARAVPAYMKMLGVPGITMERFADVITIVRRLWAGGTVHYEGIMGKFPVRTEER